MPAVPESPTSVTSPNEASAHPASLHDRPTAVELLEAIAATLHERVLPAVEGSVRHDVRVAANLCRLIAREAMSNAALQGVTAQFQALVNDDSLIGVDLLAAVSALIDAGDLDATTEAAARAAALAHVEAKLAANQPGYNTGGAL